MKTKQIRLTRWLLLITHSNGSYRVGFSAELSDLLQDISVAYKLHTKIFNHEY